MSVQRPKRQASQKTRATTASRPAVKPLVASQLGTSEAAVEQEAAGLRRGRRLGTDQGDDDGDSSGGSGNEEPLHGGGLFSCGPERDRLKGTYPFAVRFDTPLRVRFRHGRFGHREPARARQRGGPVALQARRNGPWCRRVRRRRGRAGRPVPRFARCCRRPRAGSSSGRRTPEWTG